MITAGSSKDIFEEFIQKKEKGPTKIMAQAGPMNDHIVPDDMDSQQLQQNEDNNELYLL